MVKGGLRNKVRRGRKNMVPGEHHEGFTDWIKYILSLNFKVPLYVVIQRLVYVSKGAGCLWLEFFMDGVTFIKWSKYLVEDPQWGLTEEKMRPLDITR